jgi:hypothetical protein
MVNRDDITSTWGYPRTNFATKRTLPKSPGVLVHWASGGFFRVLVTRTHGLPFVETIPVWLLYLPLIRFEIHNPSGGEDEMRTRQSRGRRVLAYSRLENRLVLRLVHFHFIIADLGKTSTDTSFPCERRQALPQSFRNVGSTPITFLKSESLNSQGRRD